jgi:hypothetical protein
MNSSRLTQDLCEAAHCPATICSFTVSAFLSSNLNKMGSHVNVMGALTVKEKGMLMVVCVLLPYLFAPSPALSSSLDTLRSSGV